MMERKLQQAANALPEHTPDFLAVEEAYKQQQVRPTPRPKRRAVLICLVCLLLVGCVAGPTVPEYHLYIGAFSTGTALKAAEALGWIIPETLGDSPMLGEHKYYLTTKETSYLLAHLFYHYTYHSVDYGYEMETDITLENGSPSVAIWTDADVQLTFGSMDNEVWHRQFSFDENNVWVADSKYLNYIDTHSLQYEDFTLYVGTWQSNHDFYGLTSFYGQHVSWVDYDHNTVFQIYCRDDTPDFAIACAKELIDEIH